MKKLLLAVGLVIVVLAAIPLWSLFSLYRATAPSTAPEDYALQDDTRVSIPDQQPYEIRTPDPLKLSLIHI